MSRYSQVAQLHLYYEGPGITVCGKNLNNCNLMNLHSIWNNSQTAGWKLHQFWLVECSCDFSVWGHIWLFPKRPGEFHPTTSDGSLDAKITCTTACYICYPPEEHTLLKYSFQVLPWLCFFQNIPLRGTSKPQKWKTWQATADCGLHYRSRTENKRDAKRRKSKEENLADAHSQFLHHSNSGYQILKNNMRVDVGRLNRALLVWGEILLPKWEDLVVN